MTHGVLLIVFILCEVLAITIVFGLTWRWLNKSLETDLKSSVAENQTQN